MDYLGNQLLEQFGKDEYVMAVIFDQRAEFVVPLLVVYPDNDHPVAKRYFHMRSNLQYIL